MPTEYFEQRERALLGERFDALYAAPQETAERGVTVSALRTTPEQFAAKADFSLEASPFCKAAFVVHQPDFKPGRHPYHHAGVFYSQEPSASSAAPLLGVRPGMRVLDMCAAPGGKSSQLAAALQGRGVLVSNEYVAARADILKSNLERMGVSNAVVLNESPARIADALPEFFDRVLVDAPCSGEGMFRKEPVARQQHCEALVKQCAELGTEILDCAAAVLAPGGQLVYSTCTFAPEEDEGQVAAFLQRHPEFTLADALGNVDYTFGSEGEANRTGGLPLDVSKVCASGPVRAARGILWQGLSRQARPAPCRRKENTPRRSSSGWPQRKPQAKRPRERTVRLPRPRTPAAPAARMPAPAVRWCRAASAAAKHRQGRQALPKALQHGMNLPGGISRRWQTARLWCMAAVCCCRCPSRRRTCMCCGRACSWAACRRAALCRSTTCSRRSARSVRTASS